MLLILNVALNVAFLSVIPVILIKQINVTLARLRGHNRPERSKRNGPTLRNCRFCQAIYFVSI